MLLFTYILNWENKTGEREYFWTGWESPADARQDGLWEVSFPAKVTRAELEAYVNEHWALPENEEGEEDLRDFTGIDAYGLIFVEEDTCPTTLFEHLADDGRLYRYVGTVWGPDAQTSPGARFAELAQGQECPLANDPDEDGYYIRLNGDICYKGSHVQETVLELVEEQPS